MPTAKRSKTASNALARKRRERERKRREGLVRVEVWVRPEHAQRVREYAAGITAPPTSPER